MSRSVNEVKNILLALVHVLHLYRVALDCDTTLLFEVHVVEHLSLGNVYSLCCFKQTVGQGRFAMVDVSNNAKISDFLHICQLFFFDEQKPFRQILDAKVATNERET